MKVEICRALTDGGEGVAASVVIPNRSVGLCAVFIGSPVVRLVGTPRREVHGRAIGPHPGILTHLVREPNPRHTLRAHARIHRSHGGSVVVGHLESEIERETGGKWGWVTHHVENGKAVLYRLIFTNKRRAQE